MEPERGGSSWRIWWRSLTAEQRSSVWLFGVLGLASFILSAWYLRAQVRSPFYVSTSLLETARDILRQQQGDVQMLEEQKNKDTDRDGLTDYEELAVYHTSPYLQDSDSDGVGDSLELAMGTNPLCAEGTDCSALSKPDLKRAGSSTTDLLFDGGANQGMDALLHPSNPNTMTVKDMREYLLTNHLMTQAESAQLSDADVGKIYRAAYTQAVLIQQQSSSTSSSSTVP